MNVNIDEYPQLSMVAWHLPRAAAIDSEEALALYERNWRLIDPDALEVREQNLINLLKDRYSGGFLHV